jgi:hypothetical protein
VFDLGLAGPGPLSRFGSGLAIADHHPVVRVDRGEVLADHHILLKVDPGVSLADHQPWRLDLGMSLADHWPWSWRLDLGRHISADHHPPRVDLGYAAKTLTRPESSQDRLGCTGIEPHFVLYVVPDSHPLPISHPGTCWSDEGVFRR